MKHLILIFFPIKFPFHSFISFSTFPDVAHNKLSGREGRRSSHLCVPLVVYCTWSHHWNERLRIWKSFRMTSLSQLSKNMIAVYNQTYTDSMWWPLYDLFDCWLVDQIEKGDLKNMAKRIWMRKMLERPNGYDDLGSWMRFTFTDVVESVWVWLCSFVFSPFEREI